MKHKLIITILFALSSALAVPVVWADESGAKEKNVSKTTLKRFDKDKDGALNAEEEAAWNADKEKQKAKRAEKKKAKDGNDSSDKTAETE